MNLMEAFKALDQLNEDVFSVDAEGIKKLNDFMQNDDSVDELSVFDIDSTEDDAIRDDEECNEGDMILDCCVCHSKVFKPASEIVVDEESQIANAGEECPYCFSVEGYKIVGQVKASGEEEASVDEEDSIQGEPDVAEEVLDVLVSDLDSDEEDEVQESVKDRIIKCSMKDKRIDESIDLLTKDNTIASLLRDNMDKLSSITDVNELRDAIMDLVNESDIANKPAALKLKRDLYSKKSVGALLSTIGTYMTGEKVIKVGRNSTKSRKESFKHRRITESKIPSPYDKYFVITDEDDELVGDTVGGVNLIAALEPKDPDVLDIFGYLTDDPDFPVVEIVRDRAYPVDLEELGESLNKSKRRKYSKESFKHRRTIKESKIPAPYNKYFVISDEDDELVGTTVSGVKLISLLEPKDPDAIDTYGYLTTDPDFPVVEVVRDRVYPIDLDELSESFKHRRTIKESKIPAPYNKYFVISDEDDELVGTTVSGVKLISLLEPKDPDAIDTYGYLTTDPDFPVVEVVRDRVYPIDLDELSESFKHRRTIKESKDSDFQSAKDMWEMEDPDFDFEEYVDEFYFRAVDELSKKYKDLDVEPSIQSGMGSVFASYTRNDGKKMEASWDYEYEVESLEGAFMDATSSKDFFTAVKSFIEKKLKNASEIEESIKRRRKFTEDIDTIRITDDDIEITMSDDESEEKDDSVLDNEEVSDELTVEPVSDEAKEQIDFNSIDRESAEDAIEESLKESFGNIKFFRCSNIVPRNNRFIVEGVIGFNSGRKRNTNFVFKPRKITESKVIFKGYSKELKESVKSMSLVCRNRGKKCIAESLKVSK